MPTGRHVQNWYRDGAYRAKLGARQYNGKSNKSFSMSLENIRYLEGVVKGHRSDVVNRALDHYRASETDIFENIKSLQTRLKEAHQRIEALEADEIPQKKRRKTISNFFYKVKRHFWR